MARGFQQKKVDVREMMAQIHYLSQKEGTPYSNFLNKAGISRASIYNVRKSGVIKTQKVFVKLALLGLDMSKIVVQDRKDI